MAGERYPHLPPHKYKVASWKDFLEYVAECELNPLNSHLTVGDLWINCFRAYVGMNRYSEFFNTYTLLSETHLARVRDTSDRVFIVWQDLVQDTFEVWYGR